MNLNCALKMYDQCSQLSWKNRGTLTCDTTCLLHITMHLKLTFFYSYISLSRNLQHHLHASSYLKKFRLKVWPKKSVNLIRSRQLQYFVYYLKIISILSLLDFKKCCYMFSIVICFRESSNFHCVSLSKITLFSTYLLYILSAMFFLVRGRFKVVWDT